MVDEADDFIKSYYEKLNKIIPISLVDFVSYYSEAKYSGYPEEPGGSVWKSEGKFIYVLVRALKPRKILEIGNYLGRSSNHILQAVEANGGGEVHLLDIVERLEFDKLHNKEFKRILNDSLLFLKDEVLDYDLIVQDGCHEYLHVKKEIDLIAQNTKNDVILWSHDYYVKRPPQAEVGKAFDEAQAQKKFTFFCPMKDSVSDCGFILTKIVTK